MNRPGDPPTHIHAPERDPVQHVSPPSSRLAWRRHRFTSPTSQSRPRADIRSKPPVSQLPRSLLWCILGQILSCLFCWCRLSILHADMPSEQHPVSPPQFRNQNRSVRAGFGGRKQVEFMAGPRKDFIVAEDLSFDQMPSPKSFAIPCMAPMTFWICSPSGKPTNCAPRSISSRFHRCCKRLLLHLLEHTTGGHPLQLGRTHIRHRRDKPAQLIHREQALAQTDDPAGSSPNSIPRARASRQQFLRPPMFA